MYLFEMGRKKIVDDAGRRGLTLMVSYDEDNNNMPRRANELHMYFPSSDLTTFSQPRYPTVGENWRVP